MFWPKFEGYDDAVKRGWHCPDCVRDPFRRLDTLLHNTSWELQSWSAKHIGNIKIQLLAAREVILRLDQAQEHRDLSSDEIDIRKSLKVQCLGLASLEHTIARQRARVVHLQDDDANTRYFHLMATG